MASVLNKSRDVLTDRWGSDTLNESLFSSNPLSPYSQCEEHDGEQEDLFCSGHGTMMCVVCRRIYHSRCAGIEPINDACADFSKGTATTSCVKQIRHLITQCYAVARERDWDMNDLDRKRNDIIKTVMYVKQKIFEKVEKLVTKVTADLNRLHAVEKLEMKNHMLSLKQIVSALEEKVARIEVSKKDQSELEIFIAVQNALDKHKKMTSALGQIHDEAHKVFLKFETSEAVPESMETLSSVGEIVLNTMEYAVIPRPQQIIKPPLILQKIPEPEEYKIRKHVNDKKATLEGEINIRDREDLETCWITGIAVLKDSTLLVVDNNNNRIKLIGPNHEILNSFQLATPPFDIALLNQREAVYTLPDMKQIQFIRIVGRSDVQYGAVIKLTFDCNGIDVFNGNLIVTSIAEKCVRLINHEGEALWTAFRDDLGDKLFEWPWYVATNIEANKIYVSDRRKNTVTTLDADGDVLNVRDVRGKGPRGLVLDDIENMFMCHYMTDEVEIICTEYPRDRRVLLTRVDGIKHPQSLCYDDEKGQLLLSANNSDYISIFQMR